MKDRLIEIRKALNSARDAWRAAFNDTALDCSPEASIVSEGWHSNCEGFNSVIYGLDSDICKLEELDGEDEPYKSDFEEHNTHWGLKK